MRRSAQSGSSLKIAFIFICCILLLVAGAFLLKLFLVLKASTFDGVHQYIVEVDESRQKGVLVAFNPGSSSVTLLHVTGSVDTTFGHYLGVPVDGLVAMNIPQDDSKLVASLLFQSKKEKGITIIDKLRLLLFVNSLKSTDFHSSSIKLPITQAESEKLMPSLFLDNALYTDNETIAIVNATDSPGVASDIARQLSVIGMNVISVTTASKTQDTSTLTVSQGTTYTVRRIEHLFHLNAEKKAQNGVADITFTIGKDSLPLLQ